MAKFPQEIFVVRETPENDEPYLMVDEGPLETVTAEDGQEVATYRLVAVAKMEITRRLVPKK